MISQQRKYLSATWHNEIVFYENCPVIVLIFMHYITTDINILYDIVNHHKASNFWSWLSQNDMAKNA